MLSRDKRWMYRLISDGDGCAIAYRENVDSLTYSWVVEHRPQHIPASLLQETEIRQNLDMGMDSDED